MIYIYGLNKSGISIIKYFIKQSMEVIVWDDKLNQRKFVSKLFKNLNFCNPKSLDYDKVSTAYVTPGISLKDKRILPLKKNNIKIYRDLELYINLLKNQKNISITGTNGKSTTTKMIGDMISLNKQKCFVGGNIGKPLLDFKNKKDFSNYHVIELSSFQLESAPNFKSYISILLNISKDHLDRYNNIKSYVCEKAKIFNKNTKYNIISVDDIYSKEIYQLLKSQNKIAISTHKKLQKGIYYYKDQIIDNYFYNNRIILINKISEDLNGEFNIQNLLFTYAVSKILKIKSTIFKETIKNFKGLPHRLEKIFENKKLIIINNSKATNLEATIKSLNIYDNIYLILGGVAKQKNFKSIIKYKDRLNKCYLIGQSSNEIYKQIKNDINTKITNNLRNSVNQIFKDIKEKNLKSTILLAPGCTSFDQFRNFEDRGYEFKKLINQRILKNRNDAQNS